MTGMVRVGVLAAALIALTAADAAAIRKNSPKSGAPKTSVAAQATEALDRGLKRLSKADELQAASPRDAKKEYQAAARDFEEAVRLSPDNYQAHNGLGYAWRKLGDFARALKSYDRALALAPGFTEAIEYRAEAYLHLNRIDDAKHAYMHLFVHDRASAHVLMTAMKSWVSEKRGNPSGVDAAALDQFDSWVKERDGLASSTVNLSHNSPDWK